MKALILAAGFGSRLSRLTRDRHKVLINVGGAPLIDYPLQALISAGVTDIGVVVGHRAEEVSDFLAERYPFVEIIQNDQFVGGNAFSVLAGEEFVGSDSFVV